QTITIIGTGGTYILTFNGQSTGALAFNATADSVALALNSLSSVSGQGGSVTVVGGRNLSTNTVTFSVLFGGALAANDQNPITIKSTGAISTAVTAIARHGGQGALHNVSGLNSWSGPVTIQTSSLIGVDPTTNLTVTGVVQ